MSAPPNLTTSTTPSMRLRGPASLVGTYVEVDETIDDPTPSPRFQKSLKCVCMQSHTPACTRMG